MATDPYVYPGTDVLKNLAGIKEHDRLPQFEAVLTAYRISELRLKPIPGPLDSAYLQKLHRFIFQDVYSWAGEFRSVDIRKEGEFWFCRYQTALCHLMLGVMQESITSALKLSPGPALSLACRSLQRAQTSPPSAPGTRCCPPAPRCFR